MRNWEEYSHVLKAENEQLREHITQLEKELGLDIDIPVYLGLTKQEAAVFSVIYKNEAATKSKLMMALYGHLPDINVAEEKVVDVFVCKIRAKLKKFGIEITTLWGVGFQMTPASKKIAKQYIESAKATYLQESDA